jgi:hypothetical protein
MVNLGEVVSVSEAEAFSTEIHLKQDFYNEVINLPKLRGYVPNQSSRDTFKGIIEGLHPTSMKRVHSITGPYGTGKSHLGLVLANYFSLPVDDVDLQPLLDKINEKDPELEKRLINGRKATKPYLVVIPEPYYDSYGFNHSLLVALVETLRKKNIDYQPKTDYQAAIERIGHWKSKDKEAYKKLKVLLKKKRTNPDILISRLQQYDSESYDMFCEIHREIAHGASFMPEESSFPQDVYSDVINALRKDYGYQGIIVIYDEFGGYLSRMADDPMSIEGQDLQKFAEYCKRTGENQCHLIVIAHMSLKDYAKGKRTAEEWEKIYGRFVESDYYITTLTEKHEMEDLIGSIIVQNKETLVWREIEDNPEWTILSDLVEELNLYPNEDRKWIKEAVIKGAFPLHPISTYCLPWLSEKVGQRNRTLFTFFADDRRGGLKSFINSGSLFDKDKRFSLYTVDQLFNYFDEAIKTNDLTRPIYAGYEEGNAQTKGLPLGERILKAIAILQIIGTPNLPPTEEHIASSLNISINQKEEFSKVLSELIKRQALRFHRITGTYAFRRGITEVSIEEEIRREKKIIQAGFNLVQVLNRKYALEPVNAREYNDKYSSNRKMKCEYASSAHLSNPKKHFSWIEDQYKPNRGKYEGDGIILYIIAENEAEIREARHRAETICKHAQLVIAVPKRTFQLSELALEAEARERLIGRPPFNDPASESYQDLREDLEEVSKKIRNILHEARQAGRIHWYQNGRVNSTLGRNEEEAYISRIIEEVFPDTPIIKHGPTAYQLEGRDSTAKYRIMAMDALLQTRGPFEIRKRGGSAQDAILRAAFLDNEMLEKKEDKGVSFTYEVVTPVPGTKPKKVWQTISDGLLQKEELVELSGLVETLLRPPMGMSLQSIDLYLAAFFRGKRDEFSIESNYIKAKGKPQLLQDEKIDGDTIFKLVRDPRDFISYYFEVLPIERGYVTELKKAVDPKAEVEEGIPLWDAVKNVIMSWYSGLPQITKKSEKFDNPETKQVVLLLSDPDIKAKELLREQLPSVLGFEVIEKEFSRDMADQIVERFTRVAEEINKYADKAAGSILDDLGAVFEVEGAHEDDLVTGVRDWFNSLPESTRIHAFGKDEEALKRQAKAGGPIKERFLINLPKELGLGAYLDWETIAKGKEFMAMIRAAKMNVETYSSPGRATLTPKELKEEVRNKVKESILSLAKRSGLKQTEIIRIFREILEELEK